MSSAQVGRREPRYSQVLSSMLEQAAEQVARSAGAELVARVNDH